MKKTILVYFFFFFGCLGVTTLQAACYFIPTAPEVEQLEQLEQWGRSLLNEFVAPIKPLPSAGISTRELEAECHFDLRLDTSKPMTLSLVARNAPVALDGVEELSELTPAYVEQALLRIIWDTIPEQHKAVCLKYADMSFVRQTVAATVLRKFSHSDNLYFWKQSSEKHRAWFGVSLRRLLHGLGECQLCQNAPNSI